MTSTIDMLVPPVVQRELRIALRRNNARTSRFRAAAAGAGLVTCFLLIGGLVGGNSWAGPLHLVLFVMGLYFAVAPSLEISVGLFCEERRNQTLELLYLAGMNSVELFAGKLLGGILAASGDLLALTPLLAVPFLSGGVSLSLFLATVACLPVVLLFVVAMGTLASVLCRDDGASWVCAVLMIGAACLAVPLPYHLGNAVAGAPPFAAKWLCLSPAYGPYLVAMKFSGARTTGLFWWNCGITLAWTFLALVLSAVILSRNWRSEIVQRHETGWRKKWEEWARGSASWRAALRAQLLPGKAYQWLVEQDRRPVLLAWSWLGGVAVLWLAGWCAWPRVWASPVNFFITALLMEIGIGVIATYTAARRIGLDRRDGALELLLTTPLSPKEMVDGQQAALTAQFRGLKYGRLGMFVLMILGGYFSRSWTIPALVSYGLIWCIFLGWCFYQERRNVAPPMWIALNVGRPAAAFMPRRQNPFIWLTWILNIGFNGRSLWRGLVHAGGFPTGSTVELFIIGMVLVAMLIVATTRAIWDPDPTGLYSKLIQDMRLIARRPVPERNDPRLKTWVFTQRLPEAPANQWAGYRDALLEGRDRRAKAETGTERIGRFLGGMLMRLTRFTGRMAGRLLRRNS